MTDTEVEQFCQCCTGECSPPDGQDPPEEPAEQPVPEAPATITIPNYDAADFLRRRLVTLTTALPGRDGLRTPSETLAVLGQIASAADQYTALFDQPTADEEPDADELI